MKDKKIIIGIMAATAAIVLIGLIVILCSSIKAKLSQPSSITTTREPISPDTVLVDEDIKTSTDDSENEVVEETVPAIDDGLSDAVATVEISTGDLSDDESFNNFRTFMPNASSIEILAAYKCTKAIELYVDWLMPCAVDIPKTHLGDKSWLFQTNYGVGQFVRKGNSMYMFYYQNEDPNTSNDSIVAKFSDVTGFGNMNIYTVDTAGNELLQDLDEVTAESVIEALKHGEGYPNDTQFYLVHRDGFSNLSYFGEDDVAAFWINVDLGAEFVEVYLDYTTNRYYTVKESRPSYGSIVPARLHRNYPMDNPIFKLQEGEANEDHFDVEYADEEYYDLRSFKETYTNYIELKDQLQYAITDTQLSQTLSSPAHVLFALEEFKREGVFSDALCLESVDNINGYRIIDDYAFLVHENSDWNSAGVCYICINSMVPTGASIPIDAVPKMN